MDIKKDKTEPLLTKTKAPSKESPIKSSNALTPPAIKVDPVPSLNAANSFRSEAVRKNWKTVLDVAMTNRNFPNADLGSIHSPQNYHNNDIFVSEKFNWIFFAIIMTLLIILSVVFCSLVYFFLPKFRVKQV